MKLYELKERVSLSGSLIEIWEASVRATHLFLSDAEIKHIKEYVPEALKYVLYQAFDSMDGIIHGFNGEMLYGMAAFTDTILMYIAFLFPLFLLWVFCLLIAIISTVGILYIRKHS